MNEEKHAHTQHLKNLVTFYLQAERAEADAKKRLDEIQTELAQKSDRRAAYASTLRVEGVDPKNIPPHLLNGQEISVISTPDEQQGKANTTSTALETGAQAETFKPFNKTHAVFLIVKDFVDGATADEVYERGKTLGFGLSRDDTVRILGRQVARELMEKKSGKYYLTAKGEAFDNFRRM